MKTLTQFLLLMIIYSFCSTVYSQSTNGSSYFPIAINNEWKFSSQLFPSAEKYTDTLRIHNKLYFGLSVQEFEPNYYFRESGDQVFILSLTDSTENLLYDFNADVGESWELNGDYNCSYGFDVTLISKNDTVSTPLGDFYNCIHFRHSQVCMDAGIIDTWFVKGIGKVRYTEVYFVGMGDFVLEDYNIVTSVNQPDEHPIPFTYNLFQNYPNPFNPITNIRFRIAKTGLVTIKVHDILGNEVMILVNEVKPAGNYEIEFDGTGLPSGVYFYQLKAGKYFETKKMILLK